MIENRKWFKAIGDRVVNTIYVRYIKTYNEEKLNKINKK